MCPYPKSIELRASSPLLAEVLQEAPFFDLLQTSDAGVDFAKEFSAFSLCTAMLEKQDVLDNEVESVCIQLEKASQQGWRANVAPLLWISAAIGVRMHVGGTGVRSFRFTTRKNTCRSRAPSVGDL